MAPYRQFSNVQNLGDKAYFPLRISKTSLEDGERETTRVYERYIFLTSYDETFESNWDVGDRPLGRLNAQYNYKQTIRKVSIGFKMPARNVAEAKKNLDFCSGLANLVYGDYARVGDGFAYQGANLRNKIKFGNLLRNELCYFEEFSFVPNFDAGVFEYDNTPITIGSGPGLPGVSIGRGSLQERLFENGGEIKETEFVYHNQKGKVYPREVSVSLSALIVVERGDFLGFGGPKRPEENQLRWSLNTGLDWPHGTGPIGVMRYMAATEEVVLSEGRTPEEIIQEFDEEQRNQVISETGNIFVPQ